MTNTRIIKNIPDDVVNMIEACQYEVNARKDIISYMLSNNMNLATESFNQYQAELVEFTKKLDLAKQEIEKSIVTPFLAENNISSGTWNLDFATKEMTITWTTLGNTSETCSCQNGQCNHEA